MEIPSCIFGEIYRFFGDNYCLEPSISAAAAAGSAIQVVSDSSRWSEMRRNRKNRGTCNGLELNPKLKTPSQLKRVEIHRNGHFLLDNFSQLKNTNNHNQSSETLLILSSIKSLIDYPENTSLVKQYYNEELRPDFKILPAIMLYGANPLDTEITSWIKTSSGMSAEEFLEFEQVFTQQSIKTCFDAMKDITFPLFDQSRVDSVSSIFEAVNKTKAGLSISNVY